MGSGELKYMEFIKQKYPQIDVSKIEFNTIDGKYSDIAIVNGEFVFKFAKHDWSAAYLHNEAAVIRFIREFVTLPLPYVEVLDKDVIKSNYIKGKPLFRNYLLVSDHYTMNSAARQIGIFLRQLHSIPLKKVRYAHIGDFPLDFSREGWLNELENIQRKISPYCTGYAREYINQIIRPAEDNKDFFDFQPVLIHGDLTPCHIFFDSSTGTVNGITGFGNTGIGDPAFDFGVLLDHLGETFVKRMNKYYGNVYTYLDRARFYAYISNLRWFRDVCDMISTRDFSRFQIQVKDRDILPVGSKWYTGKQ